MEANMFALVLMAGFFVALAAYAIGFRKGVDSYDAKLRSEGKIFSKEEAAKVAAAIDEANSRLAGGR
jgi:hypothetical protein